MGNQTSTKVDKETQQKINHYSKLFYLLKSNPKYLSKMLSTVEVENKERLMSVFLDIFKKLESPEEENSFLNIFQTFFNQENINFIDRNYDKSKPISIDNQHPTIIFFKTISLTTQFKKYIEHVSKFILEPVLELVDKNGFQLEDDPISFVKKNLKGNEEYSEFIGKELTYELCMSNQNVKNHIEMSRELITTGTTMYLKGFRDSIEHIPKALRLLFKIFDQRTVELYPSTDETQRSNNFQLVFFYRLISSFMGLPDHSLNPKQTSNMFKIRDGFRYAIKANIGNNFNYLDSLRDENNYYPVEFLKEVVNVKDFEIFETDFQGDKIDLSSEDVDFIHKFLLKNQQNWKSGDPLFDLLEGNLKSLPKENTQNKINVTLTLSK
jgi:hypothetical protein